MLELKAAFNWIIGSRQELRVKLQAIGRDADMKQAWRVAANGTPVHSDDQLADFSMRNLGFQVRYRNECAPLSDLYLGYARGVSMQDENARGASTELRDSFDLRDDEQLLVKVSYRFEI